MSPGLVYGNPKVTSPPQFVRPANSKRSDGLNEPEKAKPISAAELQSSLMNTALVIYGAMAGVGIFLSLYVQSNFASSFAMDMGLETWGRFLILAALATGIILILSYFFEEYVPSFQALKWTFAEIIGRCSVPAVLLLSFLSACGEEILFRGGIQPTLGLIGTSILFGVLHVGPGGRISAWSFWAVLAGFLMGWLFESTQSLYPPILCHFAVNLISMLRLRDLYREIVKHREAAEGHEKALNKI